MSILDRVPERSKTGESPEFALGECDFAREYPGLWEFVARQMYKGEARATGKLVIFADSGKASLCLIDRCTGQVAFYTADRLDEALRGSERALQEGTLDWRQDKKASYRR